MTTETAADMYRAEHIAEYQGRSVAVFNPHKKPIEELPVIYGFNNGGPSGLLEAVLIAEDGEYLGGHCCSDEAYMPADLGFLGGTHHYRYKKFRAKYPDGYRMEFVKYADLKTHVGLNNALAKNATHANAK